MGGAEIALSEIAWIGLRQESAVPPPLAPENADVVVLRGGRQRRGHLVGVSLGVVTLDDAELDRGAVAWIHLADLTAGSAHAPSGGETGPSIDAVALRDGSVRIGELVACAGESCYLEGAGPLRRRDIAAIAFGAGSAEKGGAAMAGDAGAEDRLVLAGGGTRDGAVYGVSPEDVVAASGTYERNSVAAILFVADSSDTVPDAYGAPPDAPPAAPPAPPPGSPAPAPSPPAAPGGGPAGSAPQGMGERGALWTGTLSERQVLRPSSGAADERTSFFSLRLREVRVSPLMIQQSGKWQKVGSSIGLENEGSTVTTRETSTSGLTHCWGQGTLTMAQPGPAGHLFLKSREVDLTPLLGYDFPRAGGRYGFATYAWGDYSYPMTCQTEGRITSGEYHDFYYPVIEVSYLGPREDREGLVDPEARGLVQGKMQGSYTASDGSRDLTVSWMLCREGDDCPPPPELPQTPGDFDPCARAGQQAAQRDTCRSQLDAMLAALTPALAEYNELTALAEANREAFQEAQDFCQLYDKAKEVLEAILSGGTGPAAEAARALVYLRDVIAKAQSGDLGSMLYPDQVKKFLGYYTKAKSVWFELTADEVSKMRRDLGACSGKVPIETYLKAKKFLEHLAAAKQVWDSKVAPGMNDLRTQGLECAYLDHAAWRECFADAECRGMPPECGPEPSLEGAYDGL